MIAGMKYKCLKCLKDVPFVKMIQLKNCPVCNQRYCNNCTDADGTCEDCLNDFDEMGTDAFVAWLLKQVDPDKSIVLALAHDVKIDRRCHDLGSSYESLKTRMRESNACSQALLALEKAYKKWSNSTR